MLDDKAPGMGHNMPPPFDPTVLATHAEKTEAFLAVTQKWLDMPRIETEQHAGQITDQIDGLRKLYKKVDAARTEAKKPHDDAGRLVQAAYTPLLKKLERAAVELKPKLAAYLGAKAKAEAEAKRQAEEAARKQAAEAEAKLKAAQAANDISAQIEAEEAAKAAEQAQKAAARPVDTSVRSASGAGRTLSQRTIKEVEVTNVNVLFLHFRTNPEVVETLRRLATAEVRSKTYDPKNPIPGIVVTEKKVVA